MGIILNELKEHCIVGRVLVDVQNDEILCDPSGEVGPRLCRLPKVDAYLGVAHFVKFIKMGATIITEHVDYSTKTYSRVIHDCITREILEVQRYSGVYFYGKSLSDDDPQMPEIGYMVGRGTPTIKCKSLIYINFNVSISNMNPPAATGSMFFKYKGFFHAIDSQLRAVKTSSWITPEILVEEINNNPVMYEDLLRELQGLTIAGLEQHIIQSLSTTFGLKVEIVILGVNGAPESRVTVVPPSIRETVAIYSLNGEYFVPQAKPNNLISSNFLNDIIANSESFFTTIAQGFGHAANTQALDAAQLHEDVLNHPALTTGNNPEDYGASILQIVSNILMATIIVSSPTVDGSFTNAATITPTNGMPLITLEVHHYPSGGFQDATAYHVVAEPFINDDEHTAGPLASEAELSGDLNTVEAALGTHYLYTQI